VEKHRIRSIIESLLFISGEPISFERIISVLDGIERKLVREVLAELKEEYERENRGIRLVEVAGGYQLETPKENAEYIARLIKTRPIRLSRPALETLAIVAYRQPITRQEVDKIRGVDSSGVLKTLLEYGFIQIAGRKDVPGKPLIYTTTKRFLEFFRLKDLSELPSPEEFVEQASAEQELFSSQKPQPPDADES